MSEFTDDEIGKLRELLDDIESLDTLLEEVKYRKALRKVSARWNQQLTAWRQGIIFISGTITLLYLLRDQAVEVLQFLLNLLGGKE